MEYSETIPIQYQEGKASFMGMDIIVDPRVLIPRPETEFLVNIIADICREKSWNEPFMLDLCTGSGIISLGIVKNIKTCRMIASDICEEALTVARENLKLFDPGNKIKLIVSDMFSAFNPAEYGERFDCIVSNPPYVSSGDYEKLDPWVKAEPRKSLFAGEEGMDYIYTIAEQSGRLLKPGGVVAVEIGYDQAEKVKNCFIDQGFKDIKGFIDFNGYERVIAGCKHG